MSKTLTYKGIVVGKGSALHSALTGPNAEKEAKKVYNATTQRYNSMYPEADRIWFAQASNPQPIQPTVSIQ